MNWCRRPAWSVCVCCLLQVRTLHPHLIPFTHLVHIVPSQHLIPSPHLFTSPYIILSPHLIHLIPLHISSISPPPHLIPSPHHFASPFIILSLHLIHLTPFPYPSYSILTSHLPIFYCTCIWWNVCFAISDKAAEILNSAGALDYVIKTMEKYLDILCKL